MSMTFVTKELRKALSACRGIVERHNAIPILGCVVIRAKDSVATIEATNLDSLLRWRLPCSGEGEFIVPFWPLVRIVRDLGDGDLVRIGVAPDNRIRIDMTDARASFLSLPIADWPTFDSLPAGPDLTIAPSVFADLIPFISTEETRYYLNGVCLDVGIETVKAVATNGHTLGLVTDAAQRESDFDGGQFIVPRSAVNWIASHCKGVERLGVTLSASKATFSGDGFEMTTKLIDGKYPDYQRVVPAIETPILLQVDACAFNRKLARLGAFGKNYCGLSYDGVRIVGSASGHDGELISIAFGGNAHRKFELQFQSHLLSDGLAFVGGSVTIRSSGEGHPLRIDGDGPRIGVVMPARAGSFQHDLPEDIAA